MPEVFQSHATPRAGTRPRTRWTVTGSCMAHGALVAAILALPALGPMALPPFTRPVGLVIAEVLPPPMPVAPRELPRVTESAPTIPLEAPDRISKEEPRPTPPLGSFPTTNPFGVPSVGTAASIGERFTPPTVQTATTQKPDGPIRPGGHILAPARSHYVAPVYPPIAVQARSEGTVILEAVIDETGAVRDVTVLRSAPLLDRAAIDAVKQWRYTPTRLNGVPVAIVMTVTVTFTLK